MFLPVSLLVLACTPSSPTTPGEPPPEDDKKDEEDQTSFDFSALEAGLHEDDVRYLAEDPATGAAAIPQTQDPFPGFGESHAAAAFNTRFQRVTKQRIGSHIYSQLQAFSHDNAYVLLIEGPTEDDAVLTVRSMSDLSVVWKVGDPADVLVPKWHPTEPSKLVHFDGNNSGQVLLQTTDVATGTTETLVAFPDEYTSILVNQTFDEISRDGRYMAGEALVDGGAGARIFVVDLQEKKLGVTIDVDALYAGPCTEDPTWGPLDPDWIGVSPLGNWLVVQWATSGVERCTGLETFDISTGAYVGHVTADHPHGDLQVLADGVTEVFVAAELAGPGPDQSYVGGSTGGEDYEPFYPALSYRELPGSPGSEGDPKYLYLIDWIYEHLSCRGPFGTCLVTSYEDAANGFYDPLEGELFLVKLDGSGVVRLGQHRSSGLGYWEQPRASLSSDGRYVIFDSDIGLSAPETAVYVIDLAEKGE